MVLVVLQKFVDSHVLFTSEKAFQELFVVPRRGSDFLAETANKGLDAWVEQTTTYHLLNMLHMLVLVQTLLTEEQLALASAFQTAFDDDSLAVLPTAQYRLNASRV